MNRDKVVNPLTSHVAPPSSQTLNFSNTFMVYDHIPVKYPDDIPITLSCSFIQYYSTNLLDGEHGIPAKHQYASIVIVNMLAHRQKHLATVGDSFFSQDGS